MTNSEAILSEQIARTENPDRKNRMEFVRPSLSADPAVRGAFFSQLADPVKRRREAWVLEGRAWHEAHLLRAFLYRNDAFAIRWFQDFLWTRHRPVLEALPWVATNPGANIWIERMG